MAGIGDIGSRRCYAHIFQAKSHDYRVLHSLTVGRRNKIEFGAGVSATRGDNGSWR